MLLLPSAVSNHPKSYSYYSQSTQIITKGLCNSQRNRILVGNVRKNSMIQDIMELLHKEVNEI